MDMLKEIKDLLTIRVEAAWEDMGTDIRTNLDNDYRRGFYAGMLFARLELKADIAEIESIPE